jgi:hypothetical protein
MESLPVGGVPLDISFMVTLPAFISGQGGAGMARSSST